MVFSDWISYVIKQYSDEILGQQFQLVEKFDLEVDIQLIPIAKVVSAVKTELATHSGFVSDQQICITEFME